MTLMRRGEIFKRKLLLVIWRRSTFVLPWRSLAGVIAHRCGEDEVARELFDDEVRLASRFDVPVALELPGRRPYRDWR
jgi:hypothetical protein